MEVSYLARNSREKSVRVAWLVEEANRARFQEIARSHGVSASALLDKVIERISDEADENNRVSWVEEVLKETALTPRKM